MWERRLTRGVLPVLAHDHPHCRYFMLTIVAPDCKVESLREYHSVMEDGWQRMSQLRAVSFFSLGWLRSFEVSRDSTKNGPRAHPHYHCLFMAPPAVNFLETDWPHLCHQSFRVNCEMKIHVREAEAGIARYLTKPMQLPLNKEDAAYNLGITEQLHWTRQISSGGILKRYLQETNLSGYTFLPDPHSDIIRVDDNGRTEEIFPSQDMTAEQWYVAFDSICERLQKERGLSRREALAVINEKMGNCQLSSYLRPIAE